MIILNDYINNNEPIRAIEETEADLITYANEFYHDTFRNEEEYDENYEATDFYEASILFEGSGYITIKLEYDSTKDKYYVETITGLLTFYGDYALKEHLRDIYNFRDEDIEEIMNQL